LNEPTSTSAAIERAVTGYSAAERALRTMIENAERLRSVDGALANAESLMSAGSSALHDTAVELAETARELKATSAAFGAAEPDRVLDEVAGLRRDLERVETLGREHSREMTTLGERQVALRDVLVRLESSISAQADDQRRADKERAVMDGRITSLLRRQTFLIVAVCLGVVIGAASLVI
jgi:chromosome segregation ATPase